MAYLPAMHSQCTRNASHAGTLPVSAWFGTEASRIGEICRGSKAVAVSQWCTSHQRDEWNDNDGTNALIKGRLNECMKL